jgi:hypothetical protein
METEFTPGPWKIVEDRVPSSLEVFGGTTAICECWRRANPETETANAHLIAAAPDMYEALEKLRDRYVQVIGNEGIECYVANAALAKARGEA